MSGLRIGLVGLGAVGTRAARHLIAAAEVESVVVMHREPDRVAQITEGFAPGVEVHAGGPHQLPSDIDVVVAAVPGFGREAAEAALDRGAHAVVAVDDPAEVQALVALDTEARARHRSVAVGTTMAPGLSDVLARWAAARVDRVAEVHVASVGTGGPACARRHHTALSSTGVDWRDGAWHRRPGGSGRELVWFPEPVGGADCYRAALPDPALLLPAFPGVRRITARLEATRRDRTTAWLPMLRRPHPEGLVGAVRVEVRGWRDGEAVTHTVGAVGRPGRVAGAVAALTAVWAGTGRLGRVGAGGLAEMIDEPGAFLREMAELGVSASVFEGAHTPWAPPGPVEAATGHAR